MFVAILALVTQTINSQEGLPIYSDYLTDNYYLLHPSMAGVSNCNKLRTTGRQQWFGDENAPSLQTVSINGQIGETSSGIEPKITCTLGYKLGDLSCYNPDQNGMLNFEVFVFIL